MMRMSWLWILWMENVGVERIKRERNVCCVLESLGEKEREYQLAPGEGEIN